jgi:tRNA (guanine-N7-)-methyltransferase
MVRRNKLGHFQDLHEWDHVFEPAFDEELGLKGTWGEKVILELGCGQGAYTIALAERDPSTTVVGVDIKGARMWHGAREAKGKLDNVYFLRTVIEDLERFFNENEVDEIWITFPDPHPRKGKFKKRLTSSRFLNIYGKILKPGGKVHLKTDFTPLYEWTKETAPGSGWTVLRYVPDVYAADVTDELLHIKTPFEKKHLAKGLTIHCVTIGLED